jgi:hypothetical protein
LVRHEVANAELARHPDSTHARETRATSKLRDRNQRARGAGESTGGAAARGSGGAGQTRHGGEAADGGGRSLLFFLVFAIAVGPGKPRRRIGARPCRRGSTQGQLPEREPAFKRQRTLTVAKRGRFGRFRPCLAAGDRCRRFRARRGRAGSVVSRIWSRRACRPRSLRGCG